MRDKKNVTTIAFRIKIVCSKSQERPEHLYIGEHSIADKWRPKDKHHGISSPKEYLEKNFQKILKTLKNHDTKNDVAFIIVKSGTDR